MHFGCDFAEFSQALPEPAIAIAVSRIKSDRGIIFRSRREQYRAMTANGTSGLTLRQCAARSAPIRNRRGLTLAHIHDFKTTAGIARRGSESVKRPSCMVAADEGIVTGGLIDNRGGGAVGVLQTRC
jgi:hypothetical protein